MEWKEISRRETVEAKGEKDERDLHFSFGFWGFIFIQMKELELNERRLNEEKAVKAEEKYKEWVKEANARPSRVSASLGYTGGRLIGIYLDNICQL